MHIGLEHRLVVATVVLASAALGCADGRRAPAREPMAASEPTPHGAFLDPSVRSHPDGASAEDPTMGPPSAPRSPYVSPAPGSATLEAPPPVALPPPEPKAPFYGEDVPNGSVLVASDQPLTDAQIVGVVLVVDGGEVAIAEIAAGKASDADVRELAAAMRAHHSAALGETRALQARAGIESAESDVTAYLSGNVEGALRDLRDADGAAFDRAYVDAVIEAHRNTIAAIDGRLAPNATNRELRAFLAEMRARVAEHLASAERVRAKLDGAAPPADMPERQGR